MRSTNFVGVLAAVFVAGSVYWLAQTTDRKPAPTSSGNVILADIRQPSSSERPVVTLVSEGGSIVLSNDDADISRAMALKRQHRAPTGPLWSSTNSMSAEQNAHVHWKKHGAEFPEHKTADQYIAAALSFVSRPPAGTLTKVRANGDKLFFNPRDGTFAVRARDGAPRTMFRPQNGMEYWKRQ